MEEPDQIAPALSETAAVPRHDGDAGDTPANRTYGHDRKTAHENPSDNISVAPLHRRGVANDGIELLKAMILRGELVAFQRLPPERDLAELLGISRSTLRESIRALISLNILESRHGDGTFVTSLAPESLAQPLDFVLRLDPRHISDLTEVRMILEPAITGLAAGRMTEDLFDHLHAVLAEKRVVDEADEERAIDLDFEFHRTLAAATQNPILIAIIESLSGLTRTSRRTTTPLIRLESPRAGTDDLTEILQALRSGDADRAAAAMGKHLQRVSQILRNVSFAHPGSD